jgi:hypothetical protein
MVTGGVGRGWSFFLPLWLLLAVVVSPSWMRRVE